MSGQPFQPKQQSAATINNNSIANANFDRTTSSSVAAQRQPQTTNTNRTTPDSGLGNDDQSNKEKALSRKVNTQRREKYHHQQQHRVEMRGSGPPPSQGPHNSAMYYNGPQPPYNSPPGGVPHDGQYDGKYDASQQPQYGYDPRIQRYQQGPMDSNMQYDDALNPNSFPIHGVNEGYDRPPIQQQQQFQPQHSQAGYDQPDQAPVNYRQNYPPHQQQMYGSQGPPPHMYTAQMMPQGSPYPPPGPGNYRHANMGPPGQPPQPQQQQQPPGQFPIMGVHQNVPQQMFQPAPQMMMNPLVMPQGQQLYMPVPCGVVKKANPSPSASSEKDRQTTQQKRSGKYGSQQSLENQDIHPDAIPPSQQFEMNMPQTPEGYVHNQYNPQQQQQPQMQYPNRVMNAPQFAPYQGQQFGHPQQQQMHPMHFSNHGGPPPPPPPHIMSQGQYGQQPQQSHPMYQQYPQRGGMGGGGGGRPDAGMMQYPQQHQQQRGGFPMMAPHHQQQQQQYHGGRGGMRGGNGRGRGGYQQNQHSRQNSGQYSGGYDNRGNYQQNYGRGSGGAHNQPFETGHFNIHDHSGSMDDEINTLANRIEHLEPSSNPRSGSPSKQMLQLIDAKTGESSTAHGAVEQHDSAEGDADTSSSEKSPVKRSDEKVPENNEPAEEANLHGSEEEEEAKKDDNKKSKLFCYKCDQMKLPKEDVESHNIRHPDGKTWCPVLRKEVCPICKATGDTSHSPLLCPLVKDEQETSKESTRDSSIQREDSEQQLPDSSTSSGQQQQQQRRGGGGNSGQQGGSSNNRGNMNRRGGGGGSNRGGGQFRSSMRSSKSYQD